MTSLAKKLCAAALAAAVMMSTACSGGSGSSSVTESGSDSIPADETATHGERR